MKNQKQNKRPAFTDYSNLKKANCSESHTELVMKAEQPHRIFYSQANADVATADCGSYFWVILPRKPESPIFDPKAPDLWSEMRVFSLSGQQDFHEPHSPLSPTLILNGVFVAIILFMPQPFRGCQAIIKLDTAHNYR